MSGAGTMQRRASTQLSLSGMNKEGRETRNDEHPRWEAYVAGKERGDLLVVGAAHQRTLRDLESVGVEDWKDRSALGGVDKLVRVPRGSGGCGEAPKVEKRGKSSAPHERESG